MAHAVLISLALLALSVLLAGLLSAARQLAFVWRAKSVQGRVVSEWRYRRYGRSMRYYRVEFTLATGQRVDVRSAVAIASSSPPALEQVVPVLLVEQAGQGPKAKIGTWIELWLPTSLLLLLGGIGLLSLALAAGFFVIMPA
ncbi:MAG: hypothetical protein K2W93_06215 [Burkholderiaceae bacterium]|nr:hypothetical protein [Burkholderiaceae bacterium]